MEGCKKSAWSGALIAKTHSVQQKLEEQAGHFLGYLQEKYSPHPTSMFNSNL